MTAVCYKTQVIEGSRTLDLISIGLVDETGREYYAVASDANWAEVSKRQWLCENVVPHLPLAGKGVQETQPGGKGTAKAWQFAIDTTDTQVRPAWVIANEAREFITAADDPQLWAQDASHQFVALCWLWGALGQRPAGIPTWTHDLRQETERAGSPVIPPLGGGLPAHHALGDAREVAWRLSWLREHTA